MRRFKTMLSILALVSSIAACGDTEENVLEETDTLGEETNAIEIGGDVTEGSMLDTDASTKADNVNCPPNKYKRESPYSGPTCCSRKSDCGHAGQCYSSDSGWLKAGSTKYSCYNGTWYNESAGECRPGRYKRESPYSGPTCCSRKSDCGHAGQCYSSGNGWLKAGSTKYSCYNGTWM